MTTGLRPLLLLVLTMLVLALDVEAAHAQAAQCAQLQAALAQFDSNSEFRQMGGNSNAARQLQRQVQQAEGDRHIHLEQSPGLAGPGGDLGFRLFDFRQQCLAPLIERFAFARKRQPAGSAIQQAHAQAFFQVGKQARNRGLG